jgi:tetratricopeptide (TPR) repeat protein
VRLRRAEAIEPLLRAISLKADYWPAYVALSDYYRDVGDLEQARHWLRKGLTAVPQAKVLERRLADIDKKRGKPGK